MDEEPEADCQCRNIPGGYPCGTGCRNCMMGVDSLTPCGEEARWRDMQPMAFNIYGPGGYAGPARLAHLSKYRLRPADQLQVIYLITRRQRSGEYRLAPGDEVLIESIADQDLDRGTLERGLVIQPDGTLTVRLLGQVHAGGLTIATTARGVGRTIQEILRPTGDRRHARANQYIGRRHS